MQAEATKKYVRISRRKIARLGRECVRCRVADIKPRLMFLPQKSARMLLETIKSAEANFLFQAPTINPDNLFIQTLEVDIARGFKRLLYRARGRADKMHKRASHIHVVITDELPAGSKKKRKTSRGVKKTKVASPDSAVKQTSSTKKAASKSPKNTQASKNYSTTAPKQVGTQKSHTSVTPKNSPQAHGKRKAK